MNQSHLNHLDTVNLGSYYTNLKHVQVAWDLILPYINNDFVILDSSCGYGNFFQNSISNRQIGSDIDAEALKVAKKHHPKVEIQHKNALTEITRESYKIKKGEKLCIIGNPPYNDLTSIVRSGSKKIDFEIDPKIKTRDLGMSFLLSYNELDADLICVLHPLSYLIKHANFKLLKNFSKNYKLIDGLIISSGSFANTSKSMQFPILIALYQKNSAGMDYEYIQNFQFKTEENRIFQLNSFEYINKYVQKYPNKYAQPKPEDLLFHTLRDINALKRNRTFVSKYNSNSIVVDKAKLEYYIYIDVFKRYSQLVPYYLGNCDVFIDQKLFQKYKKYFIADSLLYNPNLQEYFKVKGDLSKLNKDKVKQNIINYFKQVLQNHYVH